MHAAPPQEAATPRRLNLSSGEYQVTRPKKSNTIFPPASLPSSEAGRTRSSFIWCRETLRKPWRVSNPTGHFVYVEQRIRASREFCFRSNDVSAKQEVIWEESDAVWASGRTYKFHFHSSWRCLYPGPEQRQKHKSQRSKPAPQDTFQYQINWNNLQLQETAYKNWIKPANMGLVIKRRQTESSFYQISVKFKCPLFVFLFSVLNNNKIMKWTFFSRGWLLFIIKIWLCNYGEATQTSGHIWKGCC